MQTKSENHLSHRKIFIIVNILSLLLFLFILYCVLSDSYLPALDSWVNTQIVALQSPVLTKVLVFLTNVNGVLGSVIFSIFALFFLSYKKWYKARLFYMLSFSGAIILFLAIKQLVARVRPNSELIDVMNYSFPSGHATLSMTIALLLYFIISKSIHTPWKKYSLLFVCIIWAMLIAFTRVYLNVHWLSDVVAGFTLGIFWVTLMRLYLYKK